MKSSSNEIVHPMKSFIQWNRSFNEIVHSMKSCLFNEIVQSMKSFIQWNRSCNEIVHAMKLFVQWNFSFNEIVYPMKSLIQWNRSFNEIANSIKSLIQWNRSFNKIVHPMKLFIQWNRIGMQPNGGLKLLIFQFPILFSLCLQKINTLNNSSLFILFLVFVHIIYLHCLVISIFKNIVHEHFLSSWTTKFEIF